jgi:hypothetical protein
VAVVLLVRPGGPWLCAQHPGAGTTVAPSGAAEAGGGWRWLADLGSQPGVVETLLAAAVVSAVALFWWRLANLVRDARSRQALGDYLLGVEQALHGDLDGAHTRLLSVVQHDPQNHYARMLLGKVLAARGEPEQAHQQHLVLKSAFGIDTADNDLLLAQSLLSAGLPREAADAAQRALQREPDRAAAWDFVYRAQLQCGDFAAAAAAGRKLLQAVDGPAARTQRAELARTLAQAGHQLLQRGDAAGASALLAEGARLGPTNDALPLLAAKLQARQLGLAATVAALLPAPPGNRERDQSRALAAAPAGSPVGSPADAKVGTGLPVPTLQGLVPATRWTCRACDAPLASALLECPRCQASQPAELREPGLVAELPSPTRTMDAIDLNDAHVERLLQSLLDGPAPSRAAARAELLELHARAVPLLLRAAWQLGGQAQELAIDTLRAMGPTIAPALFAASDALAAERLLPLGSRSPAALVGRVVQGFDRSALPHVEPLFASAKAEHRKILIDFFLGLADLDQFQLVLERFPPLEILHRLNKADAVVLQRFLQIVPRGHFVAESLLLEASFHRDEDVLAAIPGARDPGVMIDVLLRRGVSRTSCRVLIAGLGEPALADTAATVLQRLGPGALEHVLAACSDPERTAEVRQRLGQVLVAGGAAAAERLVERFGPEPSPADDELRALLASIGAAAVPALRGAYQQSGWLERVSIGLVSRHTNRRVQVVLTLRDIGSPDARACLQAWLDDERDANLRLRLQQALSAPPTPEPERNGGGHDGQAR